MKGIIATINILDWLGFIGSFLSVGITALLTLYGIRWQLYKTQEKENKGILNFIIYKFTKNTEIIFSYDNFEDSLNLKEEEIFLTFSESFLEKNLNIIFSLKSGIKIAEVIEKTRNYNKIFLKYIERHNFNNKRNFFKKLLVSIDESSLDKKEVWKEIVKKYTEISSILFFRASAIERILINGDNKNEQLEYNGLDEAFKSTLEKLDFFYQEAFEFNMDKTELIEDYQTLLKFENIFKEQVNFEEYLIKVFELDKKIFQNSIKRLITIEINREYKTFYCNEVEKYLDFLSLKINVLKEKRIIVNTIKEILVKEKEFRKIKNINI